MYHIVAKKYKANQGTSYLSKMFITGLFYTGILYDNRPGHHFRSSGFHFSTVSALRCTECGGPTTDPVGNGGSALHACVPHEKKSLNPQTDTWVLHGFTTSTEVNSSWFRQIVYRLPSGNCQKLS